MVEWQGWEKVFQHVINECDDDQKYREWERNCGECAHDVHHSPAFGVALVFGAALAAALAFSLAAFAFCSATSA